MDEPAVEVASHRTSMRCVQPERPAHFAEITNRVRYTGEPVIVEKQGIPSVALVSLGDLDILERLRQEKATGNFARLAGQAAREAAGPEPSEEEIVDR